MLRSSLMIVFVLTMVFTACAPKATPTQITSGTFDVTKFTGTYVGTFTNQQTGASGPVTIAITADESTRTATITLDFGGNFLGLGDPPPATVQATYDDHAAYVKVTMYSSAKWTSSLTQTGISTASSKTLVVVRFPL